MLLRTIIGLVIVLASILWAANFFDSPERQPKGYVILIVGSLIGLAISFSAFIPSLTYIFSSSPSSSSSSSYSSSYSSSSSSFTNKYGTRNTTCAISGCNKKIATSGDTKCCTSHSSRCLNCYCYVDSDAMYCMSCIKKALS